MEQLLQGLLATTACKNMKSCVGTKNLVFCSGHNALIFSKSAKVVFNLH